MKERIQIDGVWYVKENLHQEKLLEINPISFYGISWETDNYYFEATKIYKDDGSFYDGMCDIEFINKKTGLNEKEYIDNSIWVKNVLNNDYDTMKEASNIFSSHINEFITFINYLNDKNFLN